MSHVARLSTFFASETVYTGSDIAAMLGDLRNYHTASICGHEVSLSFVTSRSGGYGMNREGRRAPYLDWTLSFDGRVIWTTKNTDAPTMPGGALQALVEQELRAVGCTYMGQP